MMINIKQVTLTLSILTLLMSCDEALNESADHIEKSLIINEVVTKDANGYNDWIELKNISTNTINLNEYALMDSTSTQAHFLPNITITPGELFVIEALSKSEIEGILPFGLGSEDQVFLLKNNQVVDSLGWKDGDVEEGSSYGLYDNEYQTLYPSKEKDNILNQLFYENQVIAMTINIEPEQWNILNNDPLESEYQTSSVTFNNVLIDNIGLQLKGSNSIEYLSSLNEDDDQFYRHNFKLDINKFVSGQKLFGAKKIYLQNGFNDPSFMREVLSYQLMRDIGLTAPRTSYVDLTLNIQGQLKYLGLYYMVEAVDGQFIENNFPLDNNNTGDLYQAKDNADLSFISPNFSDYEEYYELENNDSSINTDQYGKSLITLIASLNQSTASLDYINIEQIVKYLAINSILGSIDNYFSETPNDYYLYEERSNLSKFTIIPWDYDFTFGISKGDCNSAEFSIYSPTQAQLGQYPLLNTIFSSDSLKNQYLLEIENILYEQYNLAKMEEKIENIRTLIEPFISKSPTLFYTESIWQDSLTTTVSVFPSITTGDVTTNNIMGLTEYIGLRHNNILAQLQSVDNSSPDSSVCDNGL